MRTAMSKRENAYEMMVGIEREDGRYRGRTHMRTAMRMREKTNGGNFCHI